MEKELVLRPPDVRIEIDLNARSRDGYAFSRLSRADGPVLVNDDVIVFEPDDRVAAPAKVVRVDREHGFVFLSVDWSQLAEDAVLREAPRPVWAGVMGAVSNAASAVTMRVRETQQIWARELIDVSDPQYTPRGMTVVAQ
jgi:hypothetical protein